MRNILTGFLLYPLGDLIGQAIMGNLDFNRTIAMALMGGLVYRLEVPRWFAYLARLEVRPETASRLPWLFTGAKLNWSGRTLGAMLYFNPLWIARHILVIYLATHGLRLEMPVSAALAFFMSIGCKSFIANLPISLLGNYIIQHKLPEPWRFIGSATLSGIFSISYAIEYILFK